MKTELEPSEIEEIAQRAAEIIKTELHQNVEAAGCAIFDVEGVAAYLKVKKKWVYERVHYNTIPYYKMGKYPRRNARIDEMKIELEQIGIKQLRKKNKFT